MDRFDRQLRIWGGFGHGFLTDAKVCLVAEARSEPLLLEVQRHLLLAGINKFIICHSEKARSGLGDGFAFIDHSRELQALNPEAQPQWEFCMWSQIRQLSFEGVSVVVLLNCNSISCILQQISERRQSSVRFPPVLMSVSACPLAYTYLWLKEPHFVLSSNPEYMVPDLRIAEPWKEFSQYMDSIDLKQLQEEQLAELPYPVILFKALGATSQDEGSLVQRLERYYLSLNPQAFNDSNFRQAKRNVRQAMRSGDIGRKRVEQLLDRVRHLDREQPSDPHSPSLNSQIMVLCRALTQYLEKYHQLPVPGDLPDMEAATLPYNRLKLIYQERAAVDREKLQQILVQLGFLNFPKMLVQKFCENINYWTLLEPGLDENSMPRLYCGSAISQLVENNNDYSSTAGQKLLVRKLHKLLSTEKDGCFCNDHPPINGFPTTALLGGIVSQEVVKLVTHQYVPIDNTFVYDVLEDESWTFKI